MAVYGDARRERGMIYHIAEAKEWDAHVQDDQYVPERYAGEGFVHCAEVRQLEGVADLHFRNRRDLLLLEIDPTLLDAKTTYENLDGKGEKFPHIYGSIDKAAVQRSVPIECNEDGLFAGVFERAL